jgi:hypothetical protein
VTKDQLDELDALFEEVAEPKTFRQLLDEGVQHRGGLAQLAQAEQAALSREAKAKGQLH